MIAVAIWKYAYIDKLPNIVNKHDNTIHETNKMKPTDVKSTTYIGFDVESNDKDPKCEVGDHVRISK